jgi:Flp pilus assembly protein TadG
MKIRTATKFFDRLRGWWPRPPETGEDVLRITTCNCVHTFAMDVPIDIVFVDRFGIVRQVCKSVPAWRVVRHHEAQEVWELRSGEAQRWGLEVGSSVVGSSVVGSSLIDSPPSIVGYRARALGTKGRREPQSGASMLELLLALVLVIGPLGTSLLEYSQLAVARYGLQHALAEVARAAERSEAGDTAASNHHLRRVLAHHLLPAISPVSPTDDTVTVAGRAVAAQSLAMRPDQLHLTVTHGRRLGPNTVFGAQEITLTASWCRTMYFPPAKQFIGAVAGWLTLAPFDALCFIQGGFPLRAEARAWRPLSRPSLLGS